MSHPLIKHSIMACLFCICVMLMTPITAEAASASTPGHFPLKNCTEENVDLLFLLDYVIDQTLGYQMGWTEKIAWALHQLPSEGARFRFATVIDDYITSNDTSDVKNWRFSFGGNYWLPYMKWDAEIIEIPFIDFRPLLELKIQFVERLFEEMGGVRKEAVHVAVIFLYGASLTKEEITSVPSIVQQRKTDLKIFVVIVGNLLVRETVHLTDTLVLPDINNYHSSQYLLMAMCQKCFKDWFIYEHKTGHTMISCFHIIPEYFQTWTESMGQCNFLNAHLAMIETVEEMAFLKNRLPEYLLKEMHLTGGHIAIGLRRDLSNYAKRFHWVTAGGSYRPLVVQHWLPGEPAARCCSPGCGMWQFSSNFTNDVNSSSLSQDVTSDGFVEGWADTGCYRLSSYLSLCEIDLPQRVSDSASINIAPALNKSVNSTLTTNKRNLRKYRENIVSVSANVGNREFLQDLRKSEKDFPIFDCGEIAGDNRFVSYSMVCDSFDHCSNRMDESSCMKLRTDEYFCLSGRRQQIVPNRCDNVKDCIDGSDEENCIHHEHCDSVICSDGSCLPREWVEDGEFDCFTNRGPDSSETDESSYSHRDELYNERCVFTCKSGGDPYKCIGLDQLNDSVPHCTGPEGPLDETIGKLESANTCRSKTDQQIWAPKCHYIKDRYGGSIGCRDMSHLRGCEQFECGQGYVKCLDSYCIPQHYLRDGRADCPSGEDENLFYIGPCVGNFACWDSQICLHPELVCNRHPDCPHDDDELDCHSNCPQGFRCVAGTVTVFDYNRSVPFIISKLSKIDRRTRYMDLTGIQLIEFNTFVAENEEVFLNLQVLILSKCNIRDLYLHKTDWNTRNVSQSMIKQLDISYNVIQELFSLVGYTTYYRNIKCLNASYNTPLRSLKNLRFRFLEILDLSHTSISYLDDSVFEGLLKLEHLNLSYTLISDFSRRYFATNFTLNSLDLRGVPAKHFQDYVFHNLTISESLFTDHVQLCCPQIQGLKMPSHACIAPVDVESISSCSHLVDLRVQRVLLWLVAAFAVVGNTTVIVYRLIWDRSILKTGYGLFVTNLGVSDFFMGVYLFIIAGADHFYRDNYVLYDRYWRASVVCTFAGFTACLSCEASTFFAFLITLDRYLVMKFPFGQIKLSRLHKTIAVTMSWLASFLLSLVPIVFSFDIYSSNAMCLGLPLTNTHVEGWGFSLGVFAIFNFIMFLVIAYGQYAIFRTLSENKMTKAPMSMRSSRRATEIIVAKQLSLVVLSNFLFWFPVGLICLLSLAGHEVSNEVYTWTTVLLLPVNSAANPILYTIPALMARWEQFKHGDQRTPPSSL